jgi:hypothetical protein
MNRGGLKTSSLRGVPDEHEYDGLYQLTSVEGESVARQFGLVDYTARYSRHFEYDGQGLGNVVRSFTPDRITKILKNGISTESIGRHGSQIRYTLGENTVVVATTGQNTGKIITTFGNKIVNVIKGHWVKL